MVSELAGEGAMPPQLPAPASRSLETAELRFRLRKQIRRGSLLRRRVNVTKTIALFCPSFNRSRSVKFLSKVLNNPLFEVFYRSRSVKSSSRVLDSPSVAIIVHGADPWNERVQCSLISLASLIHSAVSSCSAMARACVRRSPAIPIQSSSKVLVNALFIASNCSSWSRSAKCSSKVLVNRTSRSRFVRVLSKLLINSLFTIFNRSKSELISDRVFVEFKVVNKVRNCCSSFRSRSVERTSTALVNQLSFVFISISLSLNMMYYERFIQVHREKDADITVAEMPMNEKHDIAFGLMKICEGRNIELAEKPKGEQMKAMKVDTNILGLDDEARKSLHDVFYVVRWNKGFLTAGGERLPQDSPQLYGLWITFLAVDVFFVVISVAVACIIGIAVCCYLPCIIAMLYAVADQEGATHEFQEVQWEIVVGDDDDNVEDVNMLQDANVGVMDAHSFVWNLALLSAECTSSGFSAGASSDFKLRTIVLKAPHGDLLACMEMAKVADLIAFVTSANSTSQEDYIDSFGYHCISVFRAIGLPSTAVLIRDLPSELKRKQDLKKACISSLASEFPEGCKFYPAGTKDELHKFMWLFKEQRLTPSSNKLKDLNLNMSSLMRLRMVMFFGRCSLITVRG